NQNGTTGVYGYDSLGDQLLPPNTTDLMGYCDNKWLSAYTYGGLLQNVLAVGRFQPFESVDAERIAAWRVLLVDGAFGARWGIPSDQPYAANGVEEKAEIRDAAGTLIEEVSVYRRTLSDMDAYSLEVPEPKPGWFSIRVSGAAPLEF
ncbi:MAG TPA: hypothetical protein VMG12_14535, partial [Polyangiaceae bacterium]|nr:hypothetical protein [Polyangiaceae bacterium]